jgi:hypothetical protein
MVVTPELRTRLYLRANGRCECTVGACSSHAPGRRCPHDLDENWTVRREISGLDTLDNLTAVCQSCYQHTRPQTPGMPQHVGRSASTAR